MPTGLFLLGVVVAASGWISPAVALLAGLGFGLTLAHPFAEMSKKTIPLLLKASVVALGFGMNLREVLLAGRSGLLYSAVGICFAMALGLGLGRLLRVAPKAGFLISAGTAICGGSAIAAVGPIAAASEEEMAVALGAVFLLNAVALLMFPPIGHALKLSQTQFGLWAALAIHDTSSVVGATAKYGAEALAVGTAVKLARALWIVPMAVATAAVYRSKTRIKWPWFILFFCLAAGANTLLPRAGALFAVLSRMGRSGLTVTLFLIGAALSRETVRRVGVRPLVQAMLLWMVVGVGTLTLILKGWIRL